MNKDSTTDATAKTNIMQCVYSGLVANEILLVKDIVIAAIDAASLYDASGSELSAYGAQQAALVAIGTPTATTVAWPSPSATVDAKMTNFDWNNAFEICAAKLRIKQLCTDISAGTVMSVGNMRTAEEVKIYITKCYYAEAAVASHRYENIEKAFRDLIDVQTKTLAIINKNTDIFVSKPLAVASALNDGSSNVLISKILSQVSVDINGIVINTANVNTTKKLYDAVYAFYRQAVYQNCFAVSSVLLSGLSAAITSISSSMKTDTHYDLGTYEIVRNGTSTNSIVKKMSSTIVVGAFTAGSASLTVVPGTIYASITYISSSLPVFTTDYYFTDVPYLLHSKLYSTSPERYVSVFDNIYDENYVNNDGVNKPFRWNIRGLPFFAGDTISYLITVSPALSQNYAGAVPKVRKYKIQLLLV